MAGMLSVVPAENFAKEHVKGSISMANISKDHNGAQFIIHMSDNHFLDGSSVVFGMFAL